MCVNDIEMGPTLIPFSLAGFLNWFPKFSSTSGIFEFCHATFVVFYFYSARQFKGSPSIKLASNLSKESRMHLSIFRNIFEIFQTSKIDLCTESVNYISKNPLRGVSPASILSLQASPCPTYFESLFDSTKISNILAKTVLRETILTCLSGA